MNFDTDRLRALLPGHDAEPDTEPSDEFSFPALHWMTAAIFLAAGAEAALGRRPGSHTNGVRWAPLLAAPLAGAAHAARALHPSRTTRVAAQLLNGVAIGVGAVGLASSTLALFDDDLDLPADDRFGPRRKPLSQRVPSLAPLAFGAAGLLGVILDREEQSDGAAHAALERRARIVERLVPKRRGRVERIVVHV
jgi:hypothetical protein